MSLEQITQLVLSAGATLQEEQERENPNVDAVCDAAFELEQAQEALTSWIEEAVA